MTLASSLSWYFAEGCAEASFAAQGYGAGNDIDSFLAYLATVQPHASPSLLDGLEISDHYNIVLTSRPRGTIPASLGSSSYFIFIGN